MILISVGLFQERYINKGILTNNYNCHEISAQYNTKDNNVYSDHVDSRLYKKFSLIFNTLLSGGSKIILNYN